MNDYTHLENVTNRTINYIQECSKLSEYHKTQAINATNWHNFTGILQTIVISSQVLTLTVMTSLGVNSVGIGITGAVFGFLTGIITKVKQSYAFDVLSLQHNQVADDFSELASHFNLLHNDIERDSLSEGSYEHHIIKFSNIKEKAHLKSVRNCQCMTYFLP